MQFVLRSDDTPSAPGPSQWSADAAPADDVKFKYERYCAKSSECES